MITDKGISNNNHRYMGLSNLNILQLILLNKQILFVSLRDNIMAIVWRLSNEELTQSQAELSKIYQDIDKLEKTKMNIKSYDHLHDAYMPFAWLALLLFCFELILRWTVFRRLP